jgi:nucleotide-binding universal stress UspA family protein
VLVPVDGSALSERAIAVAERLAVPAGERIVLLHVLPPVNPARLVRISEAAAYRALEGSFAKAWQILACARLLAQAVLRKARLPVLLVTNAAR